MQLLEVLEVDHRTNLCNLITYTYTPFLVSFTLYGITRFSWWNIFCIYRYSLWILYEKCWNCLFANEVYMQVQVHSVCVCVCALLAIYKSFCVWVYAHFSSYKSIKENVMYIEFILKCTLYILICINMISYSLD